MKPSIKSHKYQYSLGNKCERRYIDKYQALQNLMVAVTKQCVVRYLKGSFVLSQSSFCTYLILRRLCKSTALLSLILSLLSFLLDSCKCTRGTLVFCRLHAIAHWRFNAPKREATVHVASRIDVRYSSRFMYQLFTRSEDIQTSIKTLNITEAKYCEVL